MDLFATVQTAYQSGVELAADGRNLKVAGYCQLTPELRAALLAHKPAIVALLSAEGVGNPDDYPSELPTRYLTPPGCVARGACARLGWCERALVGAGCVVPAKDEGGGA